MELRTGYKQTEIGVIPEDWCVQLLGAITDPNRPISYGIVQTGPSVSNGVKCLRVLDIESGRINKTDLITTTKAISDAYKRTILRAGDLVTLLRGKVGDVALVDEDLAGSNLTRGVALIAIRSDWSAPFCKQAISSSETRSRLENSMNGSALQEVPVATLRAFKISLPPTKAEQEAIAEALSNTDALIESLDQLITRKRQIKQGAMQELLTGKKRLPGFSGEWKLKRLGELFEITSSKRVFQNEWTTRGIPFYRARELAVLGEQGYVDNELFITKELYASCKKAYGLPATGDILVTGVGTLGKVYAIEDESEFYFKDGNIIWFKSAGKISSEFLKQLYSTPLIIKQIEDGSEGTTVGTYTITNAKNTIIPFPLLPEQTDIATILSDMDAEIDALETKLTKTRSIKQGMMHELLTGKIRLV